MHDFAKPSEQAASSNRCVRLPWLLAVFVILFGLQVGLYGEAFSIQPSGDDFAGPVADIWRGQSEGPLALIARSSQPHNYRPLQSIAAWAAGSISDEHRLLSIHLLHFAGMAVFALAAAFWLSVMPVSRIAAACAGCVLFAHPALVAPLAGIDGFSTLFSTGFMWMSVWILWRWRHRLLLALPASLLVYVIAFGFKEYALGTVPLACLAMLCFSRGLGEAFKRAFIVGLAFSVATLGMFWLRTYTIPAPDPGQEIGYFIIAPVTWIKNAALLGGVVFFPGSSTWVFLNQSAVTLAITAGVIGVVSLVILIGLLNRNRMVNSHTESNSRESIDDNARRWMVFSVIGLAFASFPAVLIFHVSEMYAAGMIIALIMLVGLAVDGARNSPRSLRTAAALVFAGSLVWMTLAVRGKISDMRASGERAMAMLEEIDALIPTGMTNIRVGVIIPPLPPSTPRYSVFVVADDLLCAQPLAMQWRRPHSGIRLEFHENINALEPVKDTLNATMIWDAASRRMTLQDADWSHELDEGV